MPKRFHAACLRRWLICKRRLPVDKLAAETGTTRWKVNERIRKFVKMHLMQRDRFGSLQLLDKARKERDVDVKEEVSRIANEVMASDLPDSQVIVYGRLCGLAGEKGWWFGTNAQLVEECGFCLLRTLRTAVRGLEAAGLIRVDRYGTEAAMKRGYKKHGGGANRYCFLGHDMFRQSNREG